MSDITYGAPIEGFLTLRERSRANGGRCEFGICATYDIGTLSFAVCPPCGWTGPYRYTDEGCARDFTIHAGYCPLCSEDPGDWGGGHAFDALPCELVLHLAGGRP